LRGPVPADRPHRAAGRSEPLCVREGRSGGSERSDGNGRRR